MKNISITLSIFLLIISSLTFAQEPTFLSNFEDQNTEPETGGRVLIETGTSGGMYVVPNPHPDARNSSAYVLKQFTESGTGGRAEYSVGRLETNEKKYIYSWKRFFPIGFWTDVERWFAGVNQWKTWPCESGGKGDYEKYDSLICGGGGIFNDMSLHDDNTLEYKSRAHPSCKSDFISMREGVWNEYVLEVYWTNTENGYYRIWKNDTLFGYSDGIKTLFDEFPLEGNCNLYWATGIYTGWAKTGNMTKDSLIAYTDDVTIYDIADGHTIQSVCPNCEVAPSVTTDRIVYKINLHGSGLEPDGYNNSISSWRGDTSAIDLSSTFGQCNGIDLYLWSDDFSASSNSIESDCFPQDVIGSQISWSDTTTRTITLKNLNPASVYTFKILAATEWEGDYRGTQIWTSDENRDTVYAAWNTCDMAELSYLVSDELGNLNVFVKSINDDTPRAYINSIEIVEHIDPCFDIELIVSGDIQDDTYNQQEGAIQISVNGGSEPYSYNWSNGMTTQNIDGLAVGNYTVTVTDNNGCNTTSSFAVQGVVNKQLLELNNQIQLIPNPVENQLIIQGDFTPSSITIYTINGKAVKYVENKKEIDVSNLNKGTHSVVINIDGTRITKKIIKK